MDELEDIVTDAQRIDGCIRIIKSAGKYKREMALWTVGALCELADTLIHTKKKAR